MDQMYFIVAEKEDTSKTNVKSPTSIKKTGHGGGGL
jgi:hypothetical protein